MEEARRIIPAAFFYRFTSRPAYEQCIMTKMFFHPWLTIRCFTHGNHVNNFNIFQAICLAN